MKLCTIMTMGLYCLLLVGCSEELKQTQDRHLISAAPVLGALVLNCCFVSSSKHDTNRGDDL